jgi:uncharacterized membrane protein
MKKNTAPARSYDKALHVGFEIGLLLKGIDGILEIIGGILMLFITPDRLSRLVVFLTQHELSVDPNDIVANLLIKWSSQYTAGIQHFGFVYLETHGIVKLVLIMFLYRKSLWSYPLSIIFLLLFIVYQMHRYAYTHSVWLIVLSVLDIVMVYLTWREYAAISGKRKPARRD